MATIKDIAEMAGVSITTVSRILNNDSSLSTTMETKQKVIDAAKKLNYKKVGRSTKATFRLGIVQWFSAEQELQDTYYLSVRNGIEDFCIKNCIQIVRAFKTDVNYMDYLENINGLICIGKFSKKEVKELKRISKNIVFLDMPVADYSVTSFTLDFEYAVNKAMSYLTKLGHTKIGFLGGREILDTDEVFDDEMSYLTKNKEETLKFNQAVNNTYIFPDDVLMLNDKIVGYTSKFVSGKNLQYINPLSVNINNLMQSIKQVKEDTKLISENKIKSYDVIYNIMYDYENIAVIDTDEYNYSMLPVKDLIAKNNYSFNIGIKQFLIDNYFDEFVASNKELNDMYNSDDADILELLRTFRQCISEQAGYEISNLNKASFCLNKTKHEPKFIRTL